MSLNGALQIGRSAIVASQAAMQVAGNNMANAATEGFHRRSIRLAPTGDEMILRRVLVGTGVQVQAIRREKSMYTAQRLLQPQISVVLLPRRW